MAQLVSEQSKLLIRMLLTDTKIAEKIFENREDKEKYKICTIQNNGTVVMGKTSYYWWNQLIGCRDKIPFESFALRVWDALVDQSAGLNKQAILKGLSQEIIEDSIRQQNYDDVIRRLFECWSHVAQHSEGYQEPRSSAGDAGKQPTRECTNPHNIVINVNGNKRVIPFVDSIGDPFIDLEFGITNVRCRGGH